MRTACVNGKSDQRVAGIMQRGQQDIKKCASSQHCKGTSTEHKINICRYYRKWSPSAVSVCWGSVMSPICSEKENILVHFFPSRGKRKIQKILGTSYDA
jgi:hypothetical protein